MKSLIYGLMRAVGLVALARARNRRRVTILCYHGVTRKGVRYAQDVFGLHLPVRRFIAQLEHLRSQYHVVSLREYVAARRTGRALPSHSVVLTFDDGYRNFLTVASPLLKERGLPTCLFVVTDHADPGDEAAPSSGSDWVADNAVLSWDELRALDEAGQFAFGSHTCSHAWLPELPALELDHELRDSLTALTGQLRHAWAALAYPKGGYSAEVLEAARGAGYDCALGTQGGSNDESTDLFALRRELVDASEGLSAFAARVSGLTSFLKGLVNGRSSSIPRALRIAKMPVRRASRGERIPR